MDLEMRFAISYLHMNDRAAEMLHHLIYVFYLPISGRLSKLGSPNAILVAGPYKLLC